FDVTSQRLTTIAGSAGVTAFNDAVGTAARFSSPDGVVADGNGSLFIADVGNHRVRKLDIATNNVTTFAGSGANGVADGTGTGAQFKNPTGTPTEGLGTLYVSDSNRIRQIVISSAVVTTIAGQTTAGSTDAVGTAAQFSGPKGMTYDGQGNLYIVD